MNQPTQVLNITQSPPVRRTCPKCGYIRATIEASCADCGKVLQKVSTVRVSGIFLVVMGTLLLGIMGWLSLWIYGAMSPTGNPSGSRFNGSGSDALFIIFAFGLVISISLAVTAGGLWQIIFGRRNKLIVFAVFGFGIIFAVTGLAAAMQKFLHRTKRIINTTPKKSSPDKCCESQFLPLRIHAMLKMRLKTSAY